MTGDHARTGPPERLYLVRHGQSTGNVAHAAAAAAQSELLELETRDMDVPLSDLGRAQASALGAWLAQRSADELPTVALVSPYLRARQTAEIVLDACCPGVPLRADERLRDRDLGIFEGLTWRGIQAKYPDLAALRTRVGKFYQRPPGGEAWTDVILRLRSVHQTLVREYAGERVIVFSHDVVVLLFRYVYDGLDEATALDLGLHHPVRNASLSTFVRSGDRLVLDAYNVLPPGLG
ncbi:histidine phosphatase family protein [Acidothermaceae bacterium B102]|nr:histidine phosphatase family protein [Acidothermaceae bacterium B102]